MPLFSHCWSALVGRLSVLECALWGFLLLFVLLNLFPLLRLFVTNHSGMLVAFFLVPQLTCGELKCRELLTGLRQLFFVDTQINC